MIQSAARQFRLASPFPFVTNSGNFSLPSVILVRPRPLGIKVLFVRSGVGWTVHDDGSSHSATADEISALSSTWTCAVFRRVQLVDPVPMDL